MYGQSMCLFSVREPAEPFDWESRGVDGEPGLTDTAATASASTRVTPRLLGDVCRLSAAMLECEYCCLLLWRPAEADFVPTAHHGATAAEWERIRRATLPQAVLGGFLARLQRDEVVHGEMVAGGPFAAVWPSRADARSQLLHTGLRSGEMLLGIQIAGRRERTFTSREAHLARELGRFASGALDCVREMAESSAASQLKSEFVATLSHEMRTPLHIILGYGDLLRDDAFGRLTAEQADTLERIEKSARDMLTLVNGALDLSRLEGGRLALTLEETHVATVLRDIDVETQPLQDKPGVALVYHVPGGLAPLWTDALKLKVALKNLVVNALKFTDEGVVRIEVVTESDGLTISVQDSGIGMSPDMLPLIFEPFRQAPGLHARHAGGVGLGLYIVRRVIELLGGKISATSTLGRGSTFRVWLPHRPPSSP